MAVYTTDAAVKALLGTDLVVALQDFDEDGSADTGVMTARISDVTAEIDAQLAEKYSVPFADIGDATPTPAIIEVIAKHLVAERLLLARTEQSRQATDYGAHARHLLQQLREGTMSIPSATRTEYDAGHSGFHYDTADAAAPKFSGLDSDDEDPMARY